MIRAAHPLIAECAALGILLEPEGDDGLAVEPADLLTDDLRARLVAAKSEVLAALAAEASPVAERTDPGRDPTRWDAFVAACVALGVTADDLARHFPEEEDREDLRLTPDADLEPCAQTIAEAVRVERLAARRRGCAEETP